MDLNWFINSSIMAGEIMFALVALETSLESLSHMRIKEKINLTFVIKVKHKYLPWNLEKYCQLKAFKN